MHEISLERTFTVQRARDRACFDHGWLKTCHSFSFADYYDPTNVNWGALRVLNDDVVAPGQGFPTHPHRDMEIITYVLSGQLEHRDSTGSHGVVGPGGAQFMSAGTGVQHSEFNHSKDRALHFLQMWVVPGKLGSQPAYGQVEFTESERRNRWLAVASGHRSVDAPVQLTADAAFLVTHVEDRARVRHTFEPERLGFLFLAEGKANVEALSEADEVVATESLSAGDAIRMSNIVRVVVHGDAVAVLWDLPLIAPN
jgi:redox-sensitive bicupin YhaK (pirin superfamily)